MLKQLLTKTLLAAAGLCVGASAWADVEITETYDFGSFITANGTANLTISGDAINQSGTSAKVGSVKVINNLTAGGNTLDLNGRFAVDYQYNAGSQIRFMWRSSSNAYQHGLAGQWNGNGKADAQGAARFSVLNLKAGDKITFTYAKQSGRAADPYTCSASQLTGFAADAALTSNTQYTVAADGNLDLYFTNNNFAISKIVIVTTGTETVSEPTVAITGAYNKTRKVTITAGSSDAGNDVTTYYTTDGNTPTTSSNSFTTASQEITIGEGAESESTVTVKAISISSSKASSEAVSSAITVGTIIKLAQPTITLTNMALDEGKYYKQYTFAGNSEGTYGSPAITVTGSLGSETVANPYTASVAGTISVVASADGYADSDAATLDVDGSAFQLARAYDFTQDSYRDGLNIEGNNITITGAGVQVYRITEASHIDGLTLSPANSFGFTKAVNSDTRKGLAPRWANGSITINNWIDGSFATLTDLVGNGIYATTTNGTISFGGQINNNTFTALDYYIPADATTTVTVGANGYTTFASPYALDLTNVEGLKAYKATLDGATLKFEALNQTVAAGTGLLLLGETKGGTYNIPIAANGNDVTTAFVGVTSPTAKQSVVDDTYYFVMKKATSESDPLAFAPLSTSAEVTIPAGKAYIEVPNSTFTSSARSLNIVFDDETTGINTILGSETKVNDSKAFYNLQGQRVAAPQKGLYIVNGKKVIVK